MTTSSASQEMTSLPSAHAASYALISPPASAESTSSSSAQKQKLKKATSNRKKPTTTAEDKRSQTDPRHLAIALHHAHQIQAQKDTEALILDNILQLIELPTSSPSSSSSSPSEHDVTTFKMALRPFRPSDYDELVRERNIEDRCGYALCPRQRRKEADPTVRNRIVWGARGSGPGGHGRDIDFVPREKLEMWCSDECAERALYVKVQLQEQPVWERHEQEQSSSVELLTEARSRKEDPNGKKDRTSDKEDTIGEVSQGLQHVQLLDRDQLALERGDINKPAFRSGRVDVSLVEKDIAPNNNMAVVPPKPQPGNGSAIEGYVPRENVPHDEDDNDLLDVI